MHQATDLADNMMCIFIYTRVLVLLKKSMPTKNGI